MILQGDFRNLFGLKVKEFKFYFAVKSTTCKMPSFATSILSSSSGGVFVGLISWHGFITSPQGRENRRSKWLSRKSSWQRTSSEHSGSILSGPRQVRDSAQSVLINLPYNPLTPFSFTCSSGCLVSQ